MTKTTQYFVLITWYFSACMLHHEMHCAKVNLESESAYSAVCLGYSVEVICSTTTAVIGWELAYPSGYPTCENVFFGAFSEMNKTICNFSLKLLSTNPFTSTATLASVGSDDNGAVLTCVGTFGSSPQPDEMASITLFIQDPPSAPLCPEIFPQSLTSVTLSWTSPTLTHCVTNYTITLTNITEGNTSYIYNTTTNTTNKMVSDLREGMEYSFTVAGVDTGGRVGEKSTSSELVTLDTPENVTGLKSLVTDDVITITWLSPPSSSRPLVTGYKISHNTTGSVLMNHTIDTEFTVEGVAPGVYSFAVTAVNILGDGENHNVIVTVHEYFQTTISSENMLIATTKEYLHSLTSATFLRHTLIFQSSTEVIEATQLPKELKNLIVPVIITSVSIIILIIPALLLIMICLVLARKKFATGLQDNLTCSENVAYDSVTSRLRIPTQPKVTCSANAAYTTMMETREDSMRNTTISHTVVYDEVTQR